MPLSYSQWIWGFEVYDSPTSEHPQNNILPFSRSVGNSPPNSGNPTQATLNPGVYTCDEFAAEVARALNDADQNTVGTTPSGAPEYSCAFDFAAGTPKFTVSNNEGVSFSLLWGSGSTSSPAGLLGWASGGGSSNDKTGATSYLSGAAGATPSTAKVWTAAEPLVYASPVTAQGVSAGYASRFGQRAMNTIQSVSDGATIESVYVASLRKVQIAFRALTESEQAKMEDFLDWVVQGKRFTWQPDKTSSSAVKLVLSNPAQITNSFEWLTRSETGYGTLTFFEQLS